MKEQKGITLVALVVTIVVLLIVILFGILFRRTVLRRLEDGVFY